MKTGLTGLRLRIMLLVILAMLPVSFLTFTSMINNRQGITTPGQGKRMNVQYPTFNFQ
jgi:hypothetical protein